MFSNNVIIIANWWSRPCQIYFMFFCGKEDLKQISQAVW